MTTEEIIRQLREAVELQGKATAEPWTLNDQREDEDFIAGRHDDAFSIGTNYDAGEVAAVRCDVGNPRIDDRRYDAAFIVAARNLPLADILKLLEGIAAPTTDKNVAAVIALHQARAARGLEKYGVTTERTDLTTAQWLQHAQDEAMDFAVYLEVLKSLYGGPHP